MIARMQADGAVDQIFGDGGSPGSTFPKLNGNAMFAKPGDVTALDNSDVLVSGGEGTAFVARLFGGSGNDSPGVLGVRTIRVETTEEAQEAIVTVRRMGGKAGSVSAAYETHATPGDVFHAIEGQDFTAVSGRLDWADGAQQPEFLSIPINDDSSDEPQEHFTLQLSDATGGAVIGPRGTATILIADDDVAAPPPPPLHRRTAAVAADP